MMKEIPVNIRVVGVPQGSVLIYLEDYVHTFLGKLLENYDGDERKVVLYGSRIEENNHISYLVSGAMEDENYNMPVSGERFFPESEYLGQAILLQKLTSEMSMIITTVDDQRIVINSYYIYYDQNEEMQNYLIEWNLTHNKIRLKKEDDSVVRYGRMVQAYNKEEVKVGTLWGMINLLCLCFIVCVLAYVVVSVNSYRKLQKMEDNMNYIMTVMSEKANVLNNIDDPKMNKEDEILNREIKEETNIKVEEKEKGVEIQSESNDKLTKSQYYIVQKGDTLFSICMRLYSDAKKMQEVCKINNIDDPNNILCGQKLLLP